MLKKTISGMVLATLMAGGIAPAAALAHGNHRGWYKQGGYERGYREGYREADYRGDRRYYRGGYRCKRDNGTGGLVIGAIAGGLLGNQVARDKTAGTIIGGGVGALAGRAIDKSDSRC